MTGSEKGRAILSQRNKISDGDLLELVTRDHEPISFAASDLRDEEGKVIDSVPHPQQRFSMSLPIDAEPLSMVRKKRI